MEEICKIPKAYLVQQCPKEDQRKDKQWATKYRKLKVKPHECHKKPEVKSGVSVQ